MLKFVTTTLSFSELRKNDCLYIDKTPYLAKFVKSLDNTIFLSRPRRFGKSLLISTLESLFNGEANLFDGLSLNRSNYDFPTYPILKFDISRYPSDTPSRLEYTIYDQIVRQAKNKFDIKVKDVKKYPATVLTDLVETLMRTTGQPTVILVDEYDAPIIAQADDLPTAKLNIKVLHDFYSAIKGLNQDGFIRFAFITGVSKFSMTSIFSGANVFEDISENEEYANICGITRDEFENNLSAPLANLFDAGFFKKTGFRDFSSFREALIGLYDGYSWNGVDRVFNPFSLLKAIKERNLDSYWYRSGQPTFLTKFIRSETAQALSLDQVILPKTDLGSQIVEKLTLTPLLYQTGYLTMAKPPTATALTLKIPNQEVRDSFESFVVETALEDRIGELTKRAASLLEFFRNNDADSLTKFFTEIVTSLPVLSREINERTFRFAVFLLLQAKGLREIDSELRVEGGRLDLFFKLGPRRGVLLELKHLRFDSKVADNALSDAFQKKLLEAEIQLEKYYQPLLDEAAEVDEVQGIALAVCWGRGVEAKIGRKVVRGKT